MQRAFDSRAQAGTEAIVNAAAPAPAASPIYSSELRERGGDTLFEVRNLPQTHGIKPEYTNSGRWIAQPGS